MQVLSKAAATTPALEEEEEEGVIVAARSSRADAACRVSTGTSERASEQGR